MNESNENQRQVRIEKVFEQVLSTHTQVFENLAKYEQKERELCYPTQVSRVGRPLC